MTDLVFRSIFSTRRPFSQIHFILFLWGTIKFSPIYDFVFQVASSLQAFRLKYCMNYLSFPQVLAPRSHIQLIFFNLSILKISGKKRMENLTIMNFSPASCRSLQFRFTSSPLRALFSTPSCHQIVTRGNFLYPYKAKGKTTSFNVQVIFGRNTEDRRFWTQRQHTVRE